MLVEPVEGEETDYESDYEADASRSRPTFDEHTDRTQKKIEDKSKGIFKYLTVVDPRVSLPPMKPIYRESP